MWHTACQKPGASFDPVSSPHLCEPDDCQRSSSPGWAAKMVSRPDERRRARANQVSCCCDGILPLRRRFGSEGPQRGPGDEVSLKVERVVDGGMDAEEALGGSS